MPNGILFTNQFVLARRRLDLHCIYLPKCYPFSESDGGPQSHLSSAASSRIPAGFPSGVLCLKLTVFGFQRCFQAPPYTLHSHSLSRSNSPSLSLHLSPSLHLSSWPCSHFGDCAIIIMVYAFPEVMPNVRKGRLPLESF